MQGNHPAQSSTAVTFDAAAWAPARREYGLLHLLMCRDVMLQELFKSSNGNHLKALDTRLCSPVLAPSKKEPPPISDDDDEDEDDAASYISEGEPTEPNEHVSWGKGQRGAWWRVRASLREDLTVRSGVSLCSVELRRSAPGELLQQKGPPRVLTSGRAQGCIRMPIQPCGWVTADASRSGGSQHLIRSHAPRWRAIHQSASAGKDDVIVRANVELDSEAIFGLSCGDVVEQAGPVHVRLDGITRMPISASIRHRGDEMDESPANSIAAKINGWVTIDASVVGGPVLFKLVPDTDGGQNKRRRNTEGQLR
mmetsp:Transcript_42526/g.120299  ORF Transcript_42526/g.120299 Transcript_42526/m.120299 type:complete len:310 (-) Transcript_42526:202-1131(-)